MESKVQEWCFATDDYHWYFIPVARELEFYSCDDIDESFGAYACDGPTRYSFTCIPTEKREVNFMNVDELINEQE